MIAPIEAAAAVAEAPAASAWDLAFWLTIGAIVVLLAMSAFFSGSETALTASSRAKGSSTRSQRTRPSRCW